MHQVRADGSAVLLLADDDPVLELLRGRGGELPAMLELTDRAPVDLREPVRALLWITGRLRLPDAAAARRIAVQVADAHPHPDLLRLGHGATLVRLDPGFAVLSDAEGTAALAPVELAAARPDPFCRYERPWLAHLEQAHPEVFAALARYLPAALRDEPDAPGAPAGRGPVRAAAAGGDRRGRPRRAAGLAGRRDTRWPSCAPSWACWSAARSGIAAAPASSPGVS